MWNGKSGSGSHCCAVYPRLCCVVLCIHRVCSVYGIFWYKPHTALALALKTIVRMASSAAAHNILG